MYGLLRMSAEQLRFGIHCADYPPDTFADGILGLAPRCDKIWLAESGKQDCVVRQSLQDDAITAAVPWRWKGR